MTHSRSVRLPRRSVLLAAGALIAALACFAAFATAARAEGGEGWRPFDGGLVLADGASAGEVARALAIRHFADGAPPVMWAASTVPITLCTQQAGRPSAITADRFREVVARAAELWNGAEAAIGVRYAGDCAGAGSWRTNNSLNEIGWDDQRNVVRSPAAGLTHGRWLELVGRREFSEADIVLDERLNVPDVCFQSIVMHELGHALGFGHSDRRSDVMYPSFNASDVSTCLTAGSAEEAAWLATLYGVNRKPVVAPLMLQSVTAGALAQLAVSASDPEGDPLTYRWTQTAGPVVTLTATGAAVSFTAPVEPGASLSFRVDIFDRYLHATSTVITVDIAGFSGPPSAVPALESIVPSGAGARSLLRWSVVPEVTFYRVCTTVDATGSRSCADQQASAVGISWNTILGADSDGAAGLALSSGSREVTVAACNPLGCSAFAAPIHAGGVSWGAWGADFDVIGMAMDYPAVGVRFTVAGVVNVSGPARRFTLYAGTAADPYQVRIQNCGSVEARASCLGVLSPGQAGHLPYITVTSDRDDTPTVECRMRIR